MSNVHAAQCLIFAIDKRNSYGLPPGGFTGKLLEAWFSADSTNAAKLASVFPDYGDVMTVYRERGMNGLEEIVKNR